jgi:hypothetical protein
MTRYVVFVKEGDDGTGVEHESWLGLVEADNPNSALYQYPRYNKMFKEEYFLSICKSPEALGTHWGDTVCVQDLDTMLGKLLSI